MGNFAESMSRTLFPKLSQYQAQKRIRYLAGGLDSNPYSDILYCPVCNSLDPNKPIDDYTVRQFWHIESHLRNIALQLIETGTFQTLDNHIEYRKIIHPNYKDKDAHRAFGRLYGKKLKEQSHA